MRKHGLDGVVRQFLADAFVIEQARCTSFDAAGTDSMSMSEEVIL